MTLPAATATTTATPEQWVRTADVIVALQALDLDRKPWVPVLDPQHAALSSQWRDIYRAGMGQ